MPGNLASGISPLYINALDQHFCHFSHDGMTRLAKVMNKRQLPLHLLPSLDPLPEQDQLNKQMFSNGGISFQSLVTQLQKQNTGAILNGSVEGHAKGDTTNYQCEVELALRSSDSETSFVSTVQKMLVQNKRKMSNPAAAPSLLWKTQLGCWLILASRSFLCIGAETAVLVLRALLSLLAQSLSQKEAPHFWIPQQQLDLQLEQISIACSFLWFGLGSSERFMED